MPNKFFYKGIPSPNGTIVPDDVFDVLLPVCSGAEFKVLLYICRRTFGFKKESDNISLNQMLRGIVKKNGERLDSGVGISKPTLLRAIKSLIKRNIIIAEQRDSEERGHEATNYRLNLVVDTLGKKMNQAMSQNFTKPLVKKLDTQTTVLQTTVNNTVNGVVKGGVEKSVLRELPDVGDPPEKTGYIAKDIILKALGDEKSSRFYELVAAKVPEHVIREVLAEVKADGARSPAKLFTYKIQRYAVGQQRGVT